MPPIGFIHPTTGEPVSFEAAPQRFEEDGIIPVEVGLGLVREYTRKLDMIDAEFVAPSMLCPNNTCRRQYVIERCLPFLADPMGRWDAEEGQLYHSAFTRMAADRSPDYSGPTVAGEWLLNMAVPRDLVNRSILDDVPGVNLLKTTNPEGHTKYRLEVFPNVFMRGFIDRIHEDLTTVVDHKGKRYPKTFPGKPPTDYAAKDKLDWAYQLNPYAYMVEIMTGVEVKDLYVWRVYRGSQMRTKTFRKIKVPKYDKEYIWSRIHEWVTEFQDWLLQAKRIVEGVPLEQRYEALYDFLKSVPLDARDRKMFKGEKCTKYCAVQEMCYRAAGLVTF